MFLELCPFLPGCPICWYITICSILIIFEISVILVVISPLLFSYFLFSLFHIYTFFFLMNLVKGISVLSFQNNSPWFHRFSLLSLFLYFLFFFFSNYCPSVQFSCSVMSDSLWTHVLQHTRLPCPSPIFRSCSNSCPFSQWSHPTISSSVVPFTSHLQSFPASGSFQMSQLFASGGQSIAVSASASVLPMNIQDWFPLGWTGWIFLQSKGLSRVFSNTTVQKHQFFSAQLSLWSNSHIHTWLLEKP